MVLYFHVLGLMRERDPVTWVHDPMLECYEWCVNLLVTDTYSSENDVAWFYVGKNMLCQECKHLPSSVCLKFFL
jgi:hypothetical protein